MTNCTEEKTICIHPTVEKMLSCIKCHTIRCLGIMWQGNASLHGDDPDPYR